MPNPSPMPPTSAGVDETSNPTQAEPAAQSTGGADPMVGRTVGEYRIDRVLGKGGMGAVYEAVDCRTGSTVALKLLPDALSRDPIALKRFRAEAVAAGRLRHPNCVAVLDVAEAGPDTGAGLIAMELIRGGNARDFLDRRGPFNWPEATRVIADVCRGLAAAHAAGIVHRDIKPANILRSTEGVVKLADFGLAKDFEGGHDSQTGSLTGSGTVVGTPHYMSPEQCNSMPPDPRSDLYSLGATYYSLLTGRPPYAYAGNTMQIMFAHCRHPVPDPRDAVPDVPVRIAAIVGRALAKDPEQRYQSAVEMLDDLEALLAAPASVRGMAAAAPPSEWDTFVNAADTLRSSTRHRAAVVDPQGSRRFLLIGSIVTVVALAFIFYMGQSPDPVAPRSTPRPSEPEPTKVPVKAPPQPPREIAGIEPQPVAEHKAHTAMITFIAFAPDGKTFASVAEDGTGSLRRTKDAEELFRLADEGAGKQRIAAFLRDGSALLTGADDGMIRVWETGNGRLTHSWKINGSVRGLVPLPDGKTVAAVDEDGVVSFLGLPEGKPVGEPWRVGAGVRSLGASPDGLTLAAGGGDGVIRICLLPDRKTAFELRGHEKPVTSVVFAPDDATRLISGGEDHKVMFWNLAGRTQVKVLTEHTNCVNALAIAFQGRVLASASCDQSHRLWRLPEGRTLTELPFPNGAKVVAVAISPDNEWMAGGDLDGVLRLWRLKPVFADAGPRE